MSQDAAPGMARFGDAHGEHHGLGAAAAVGHGYRRRKLRQQDAEGSDAEWNAEEGAIALTA